MISQHVISPALLPQGLSPEQLSFRNKVRLCYGFICTTLTTLEGLVGLLCCLGEALQGQVALVTGWKWQLEMTCVGLGGQTP